MVWNRRLGRVRSMLPILSLFAAAGILTPLATAHGSSSPVVITVTTLADSGPGSLREALASANDTRIEFAVGGTIELESRIEVRDQSNLELDGSTGPSPGITVRGHPFEIRSSSGITLRNLRFRDSIEDNLLVWNGSSNVVVEHCSFSNALDENIGVTQDTQDVTIAWCIVGDTRPDSHEIGTFGMLVSGSDPSAVTNVFVHHSLWTNLSQRVPQIDSPGLFDLRNNVIRDWGARGVRVRQGGYGNIINNVFYSDANAKDAVVLLDDGGVYIDGNISPSGFDVDEQSTASVPFDVPNIETDPAEDVEALVLGGAGAFPRDAIDDELVGSLPSSVPTGNVEAGSDGESTPGNPVTGSDGEGNPRDGSRNRQQLRAIPNPSAPGETVRLALFGPSSAVINRGDSRIHVYDARGSLVRDLGHSEVWGGLNARGLPVPPGHYFARMSVHIGGITHAYSTRIVLEP